MRTDNLIGGVGSQRKREKECKSLIVNDNQNDYQVRKNVILLH